MPSSPKKRNHKPKSAQKRAAKRPPRAAGAGGSAGKTARGRPQTSTPKAQTKPKPHSKSKPNRKPNAKTSGTKSKTPPGQAKTHHAEGDRIAKVMARAGLCSRREAERWILEGRVCVNGKSLETPAYDVGSRDRIEVDGQPLPAREPVRLWRYHKPKGVVTTHRDPQARKTVFETLPEDLPRVISVGRLDFNTEGLLLLTNDGDLARYLELPSTGWLRRYRVRAHGRVTEDQLAALGDGLTVEGVRYGPIEAALDTTQGANQWLTLGLREGKNREVRKVLGALGLEVNRLIRISYGPFQLLDLKPRQVEIVRRKALADQLGPKLAETFQLTGEEPSPEQAQPRTTRRPQKRSWKKKRST